MTIEERVQLELKTIICIAQDIEKHLKKNPGKHTGALASMLDSSEEILRDIIVALDDEDDDFFA